MTRFLFKKTKKIIIWRQCCKSLAETERHVNDIISEFRKITKFRTNVFL